MAVSGGGPIEADIEADRKRRALLRYFGMVCNRLELTMSLLVVVRAASEWKT